MSDALEYLVKTRPDAVKPYFQFLKNCGTHLDKKTRNLISVITKVHAQTETGFRQYMTRAMREGATPHEILDALLMAFPALGLAKIVWAVDIILDMDIPEFHPDLISAEPGWHDVAAVDECVDGDVSYFHSDGRSVFVYRNGDEYRVYDSRCPHQVTDIPHLAMKEGRITCPKHNWVFDIKTGQCIEKGSRPLNQFEHKLEDGRLLAYW